MKIEDIQKNVGTLSSEDTAKILKKIHTYPRAWAAAYVICGILFVGTIATALSNIRIYGQLIIGSLFILFIVLIFSAMTGTIRKRVKQLRTGKLDIYEATGELGFNLVVVPGATSPHTAKAITSLILTIDKITLPAIVETYEMDRFNAFLETGLDKMHATVRYVPSISVNVFVRDDSGNQFNFFD